MDQLASDVFERALARPGEIAFWVPYARRPAYGNGRPHPNAQANGRGHAGVPRLRAVTAREFAERVTDLAAGLIAAGVAPGDRIGLMAPPGLAWTLCDYAIWTAGAVSVPADEHDAARLFRATRAVAVIARDHATASRTLTPPTPRRTLLTTPPAPRPTPRSPPGPGAAPPGVHAAPPGLDTVPPGLDALPPGLGGMPPGLGGMPPGLDAEPPGLGGMPPGLGGMPPGLDAEPPESVSELSGLRAALPGLRAVWSIAGGDLERLADGGAAVPQAVVDGRRRVIGRDDPATIVGPPCGVLTHGMLRDAVRAAALPRGASVLLHRPLTRLVPRLLQLGAVHHGCRVSYEPDPGAVPERIRSLGPSVLLATPRLLAELLERARAEAYADGRGALFALAEHTAVAYGRALANGGPNRWLRAERRVFDRLCYARLRGFLGGRATHLVCDGTPDEPLSSFYRGAGLIPLPVGTPAPAISA